MLWLDDNKTYTDLEIEWLRDQAAWYGVECLSEEEREVCRL